MQSFWKKKYKQLLESFDTEKSNNYVRLIGRLHQDPAMVITKNSNRVVNFTIVTEDKRNDKMVKAYHFVELWGELATKANLNLTKGMEIRLEGSLRTTSFESRGSKKYITKVIINKFKITDSEPANQLIINHPDAAYVSDDIAF